MTKIMTEYLGDDQVKSTHEHTKDTMVTDLPPDNGGKGRTFSPTDIFAASLGACALTIMGKLAERKGHDLKGAKIEVDKIMADSPRRVGKFILQIELPANLTAEEKAMYVNTLHSCPVHNSLNPEIKVEVNVK
ncbi:putative OsmC-like protein [Elusimicrobium simillimum]|uniref:OsmC family protein n=1 Tax=Elusimicrobium simillimum TaxID=3143438 RepID=UPI003C6EA85F